MDRPTVCTTLNDPSNGVKYRVFAYRELTREELILAVRAFNSSQKKKPKRGQVIEIISIIGM